MDYLDPRKRRAYNLRLVVGYVLVAIVIALATVILVYGANGYGINTKTGQIVQNGLLFVDSSPGGAEIYLKGRDQHATTSARLVLPAGNYSLTLKKEGYRDWTRQFRLNELGVSRYVYPFLFPEKPVATNLKSYPANPGLFTESPDRRWLLVENNQQSITAPVFDQYDLSTLDDQTPLVQQLTIPAGVFTAYTPNSTLTVVEWSTDNNNLLLQYTSASANEYIVFNRAHPDQSFNVNKMFNIAPAKVSLYNKKADRLYIYTQSDGSLRLGDTGNQTLGPVILKNILTFKPYGKDLITYVTLNGEPDGMAAARIWDNGQTYKLSEFSAGGTYLVDAAQFSGHFYYAAGSDTAGRVIIYKDPIDYIKNPIYKRAQPLLSLVNPGVKKLGFSDNARFLGTQSGQQFAVYDFETGSLYRYSITEPLAGVMAWMDGHRYIGDSSGKVFVMDYDGTNRQVLTDSNYQYGGLFDQNYHNMLTIVPAADGSSYTLQDVDMRAGQDLPKSKSNAQ